MTRYIDEILDALDAGRMPAAPPHPIAVVGSTRPGTATRLLERWGVPKDAVSWIGTPGGRIGDSGTAQVANSVAHAVSVYGCGEVWCVAESDDPAFGGVEGAARISLMESVAALVASDCSANGTGIYGVLDDGSGPSLLRETCGGSSGPVPSAPEPPLFAAPPPPGGGGPTSSSSLSSGLFGSPGKSLFDGPPVKSLFDGPQGRWSPPSEGGGLHGPLSSGPEPMEMFSDTSPSPGSTSDAPWDSGGEHSWADKEWPPPPANAPTSTLDIEGPAPAGDGTISPTPRPLSKPEGGLAAEDEARVPPVLVEMANCLRDFLAEEVSPDPLLKAAMRSRLGTTGSVSTDLKNLSTLVLEYGTRRPEVLDAYRMVDHALSRCDEAQAREILRSIFSVK